MDAAVDTRRQSAPETSIDESAARELIVRIGRLMYDRSLVVASDGNLSIRLDAERILATPTGVSKGRLAPDNLAVVAPDGTALNDVRASSEIKMHLLVYRERADVHAVCHAHPPHGTAFAVANLALDEPVLSEVILTLGCVPLAAYGTPSTAELTDSMLPFVRHHDALLLANHGAVAYGKDLWQAFDRMETLEHAARITYLARGLGGGRPLTSDQIEKLIDVRERAGYLGAQGRCQSCGYLTETNAVCNLEHDAQQIRRSHEAGVTNGAGEITLSREELVQLLYEAARVRNL